MISKLISLHTARFNWVSVKIVSGFLILYLCKVYLQQCFGKHQRTYNQEGQEKKKKREGQEGCSHYFFLLAMPRSNRVSVMRACYLR